MIRFNPHGPYVPTSLPYLAVRAPPCPRYCQMAAWNANPSCDQPEDSSSLATTANSPGGRSFVVRGRGGGGRGAAGGGGAGAVAGARGRRIGSRGRGTSEPNEAAGGVGAGEDRAWSRVGLERRESDAGSRGGGAGRGRGRSKKEDVMWVQCDKCLRWRKLALGMRLEDLPDKW